MSEREQISLLTAKLFHLEAVNEKLYRENNLLRRKIETLESMLLDAEEEISSYEC
jgi:hypothetical protein